MKTHNCILYLLCLLLCITCDVKQDPSQNIVTIDDMITGVSATQVIGKQTWRIEFAPIDGLNAIDPSAVLEFSPRIAGQYQWSDDHTLSFTPDGIWAAATKYTARVRLNKLPAYANTSPYTLTIIALNTKVKFDQIRITTKDQSGDSYAITGTILSNGVLDNDLVEQAFDISGIDYDSPVIWNHVSPSEHVFMIERVARHENVQKATLKLDHKTLGLMQGIQETIELPSLAQFSFLGYELSPDNMYVDVTFSDQLETGQETQGLVSISPYISSQVLIKDNTLRISLSQKPQGNYTFTINSHLINAQGKRLDNPITFDVKFKQISPSIKAMSSGNIIPRGEGLVFSFRSINVKACLLRIVKIQEKNIPFHLQFNELDDDQDLIRAGELVYDDLLYLRSDEVINYQEWNNFKFNLDQFVDIEKGAIYRVILMMHPDHVLTSCDTRDASQLFAQWIEEDRQSDLVNRYYKFIPQYDYSYYEWDEIDDPCKMSYYMERDHMLAQNILATDLGLIAKMDNDNRWHFVASDIPTSKPRAGVILRLISMDNRQIAATSTDRYGMASLQIDERARLLIAEDGVDKSYLRLDPTSAQNLSMFAVDGTSHAAGVQIWAYGDRGVWRPGDTLFINTVIRDENLSLAQGHPITMEWYDPLGRLIQTRTQSWNGPGIYGWPIPTGTEAITGSWSTVFKIGNVHYRAYWKVETIMPNRIKMEYAFDSDPIKLIDNMVTTVLTAHWLHGAPASGLKADISMRLYAGNTSFDSYPGYRFDFDSYSGSQVDIFEGKLDDSGQASAKLKLHGDVLYGKMQAELTTRVYEEGGAFSIDRNVFTLSPYSSYVGIQLSGGSGWRNSYTPGDDRVSHIVLVDDSGQPIKGQVRIQILEIDWNWWYDQSRMSMHDYYASKSSVLVQDDTISVDRTKPAMFHLPSIEGSFMIVATDLKSGHQSTQRYQTYWGSVEQDNKTSTILPLTLSQDNYEVGEDIVVTVPGATEGEYILSVELGDRVLSMKRQSAKKDLTSMSLKATPEMVPNAYIHLTHIQPYAQTANDLPIRTYGVVPVNVEYAKTHLHPKITASGDWEPETTQTISVSEEQGRSMQYTIAVVDEGLLQLTRFETPDPWSAFYEKRALTVKTWDLYDHIIGSTASEMMSVLAMGGDGAQLVNGAVKANRFPPVVRYLGPFTLQANETAQHQITLPNYVGAVRIMVVAATNDAYGRAELTKTVSAPLMVLSSLPRVLGPGETAYIPVTVFAMDPKIRSVEVSIAAEHASPSVKFDQGVSRHLSFSSVGEQVVYFPVTINEEIGVQRFVVTVQGQGETARHVTEIDIRPSNPPVRDYIAETIQSQQTAQLNYSAYGIASTRTSELEVVAGIPIDLGTHLDRLITYPHGCLEQTTSKAFAQLYLGDYAELSPDEKRRVDAYVDAAITKMTNFQLNSGGLAYWPNSSKVNDWASSYALDFLLRAREKGYRIPQSLLSNLLSYQARTANVWQTSVDTTSDHQLAQAYRLYTLARAGQTNIGAMNRLRAVQKLSNSSRWRLAMAYALIGRTSDAEDLIRSATMAVKDYTQDSYTFGSTLRDQAMILETLMQLQRWDDAFDLGRQIALDFSGGSWYSTQTTAFVLAALCRLCQEQDTDGVHFKYRINDGPWVEVQEDADHVSIELPTQEIDNAVTIENLNPKMISARIHQSGVPVTGDEKNISNNLNLQVEYRTLDNQPIDVGSLRQGEDITAIITVGNPGLRGDYDNLALTHIVPTGWEIYNDRMEALASNSASSTYDYMDIRDDRIYYYFSLPARSTKKFVQRLTPTYPSRSYKPAITCEAMYNHQVSATVAGQWVTVEQAK